MKLRFLTFVVAALTAGMLAGCGGGANTNTANNGRTNANVTNLGANNANVGAVVVNSNGNTNRWTNANVSREEYDRSRSDYERDKGSSTIGSGANDSWLWFKTRAALLTTSDLRESTIDVDAVNDVITLRGTVENAAQKTKAEQVAKGIDDVKSVKNELKVAPNDSMTNTGGNSGNTNRR